MSIADKLNYLITTKQLLKTEINKINNVLDDNSTFRSYPEELFNGYLDILNNGTDTLWNNLEKVSQTGTEAVLEGVETAPMKMALKGNTSQETTTGKNLFTGLIKNVRLDPNNGEEFSGSTGATTDFIPVNINSNISYYLSGLVDTIRSFTCAYNSNKEFLGRTSAQTVSEKALTVGSFTAGTPTGTGDIAYIRITQYIQGEGTIDIIDGAKMQLEQGSTATSYEPYTGGQPSPSPDYPQEVKVVKGENVVSVSGKNLFDKDNQAKIQVNAEGTLRYGIIVNAPNKKVSISGKNWSGYIAYKPLTNGVYGQWVNINRDTTINVTDKLIIYSNGDTIKLNTYVEDLQIEISDVPTPYVPYSKTDYPISLGTIEMCKIGNYQDYLYKNNGKWYVHKEIGKVVLDGSENWADRQQGSATYLYLKCTLQNGANGGLSDKFKYNQSYNAPEEHILVDHYWKEASIVIRKDRLTTPNVANFKSWLSNNNVTLYYVLATPTEEEITNTTLIEQLEAIYKAKSVKDKTYITQANDDLPFILDVEAIKEYEVV